MTPSTPSPNKRVKLPAVFLRSPHSFNSNHSLNAKPGLDSRVFPAICSFLLLLLLMSLSDRFQMMHPADLDVPTNQTNAPSSFCDQARASSRKCVFDIGLNTGQDARFYLKTGAHVVGVEANPILLVHAHTVFMQDVWDDRLNLVAAGLVKEYDQEINAGKRLTFWINSVNDKFSSFEEHLGCRNRGGKLMPKGDHTYCRKIGVPTRTCSSLIRKFGTPDYMKIDIEGLDRACLQSLGKLDENSRPKYVSIENVAVYDVRLLRDLGYRKFKVVNQNALQIGLSAKDEGRSGPWGEEAEDVVSGTEWRTAEELLKSLPLPPSINVNGKNVKGWYDMHASK